MTTDLDQIGGFFPTPPFPPMPLGKKKKLGRPPPPQRRLGFVEHLILCGLDELDLLARALLEGGDDLADRLVFLGIESLLPPHDEVGGLCAEWRQDQRGGEDEDSNAHN